MIRHTLRYAFALLIACLWASSPVFAVADENKEYLVKAAFIYNFVKFVEWPDEKAISKQSNIDVCVIGDSPLSDTAGVFQAASTSKLSLSLVEEKNWKDAARHCHIVFISDSETDKLSDILAALKNQPVLTVSDIGGFAEKGGMIGFVTNDNKVKLVVNTKAAAAAGIKVDAQLLEVAQKVI